MNRRLILAFTILATLIIAGLITVSVASNHGGSKDAAKVIVTTDKDTGQQLKTYPNQDTEGSASGLVLLNGQELASFLGTGQYQTVVDQINTLIGSKTGQEISSGVAKVLPGSVKWSKNADILHATIKQDKPYVQFVVDIRLQGVGKATVTAH